MASTACMLNAAVIAFALTIVTATFPTFADQARCTAKTTCRQRKGKLIVKTTVVPNPDQEFHKTAECSKYNVEITNHITVKHISEDTDTVTTEGPILGSSVYNNDSVIANTTPSEYEKYYGAGYENYGGLGYYKLHNEEMMWPEAKTICEEEGAHLVIINSKEEEEAIMKVMAGKTFVWIGVHYQLQGDYYELFTVLGEPYSSVGYKTWSENGEARPPSHCCGLIFWTGDTAVHDCTSRIPFVCELLPA